MPKYQTHLQNERRQSLDSSSSSRRRRSAKTATPTTHSKYRRTRTKVSKLRASARQLLDYEVAGLMGEDPAAGNMYTVKGYVFFDNPSVKTINSSRGVSQVKKDITLLDNTGTIPLHVWGDSIRKLVS